MSDPVKHNVNNAHDSRKQIQGVENVVWNSIHPLIISDSVTTARSLYAFR